MFLHDKRLQYHAKPDRPDPVLAGRLQELIGGQYGEMSVMVQYLFQGWNCRVPGKYKDLLLSMGTEEIGHVEMLATMVARLLDGAPLETRDAVDSDPAVAAVVGGMNPQHAIVAGLGAVPKDSVGVPWSAAYTVASGNLLADFRANVNAESQGRLQATRIFHMTDDPGVKDMLRFLIARDYAHQLQWLAAIDELLEDGYAELVTPTVEPGAQHDEFAHQFWNLSAGRDSAEGRFATGTAADGEPFEFLEVPSPISQEPVLPTGDPRLHATTPDEKVNVEARRGG